MNPARRNNDWTDGSPNVSSANFEIGAFEDNGVITPEVNSTLVIILYSIIVLVSAIGNSLVIKVAFSDCRNLVSGVGSVGSKLRFRRAPRTTTDRLIGSLALSDLIMTIFNIPFNIARLLLPYWPFGSFLCFGVPFVQTLCVYVSTFTMTAIALHRCRTVSNKAVNSFYSSKMLIVGVWLLSSLLAAPTVMFNTLKAANVNGKRFIRCRVDYPSSHSLNWPLTITVAVFLTQYLIPLLITGWLYLKIARIVSRQGRLTGDGDDRKKKRSLEAKRRRIFMLALVVIVFAICWLPLNLYHLVIDLGFLEHNLTVFLIVSRFFTLLSVQNIKTDDTHP